MSILNNIDNKFESYQILVDLYKENEGKTFSEIHIELTQWFSANMSAALGAVLDSFKSALNTICFDRIDQSIEIILTKNEFLTYYGRSKTNDVNRTTIQFQKLKPSDGKFFKNYVVKELMDSRRADLPKMSSGVKEKIVEAIYEIFVNAQIHSETDFIYTCGQFFPKKHKIEFTIVDRGVGFKEKVNQRFGRKLDAVQAIRWAVQDKKTTKEDVSGGIGLAVLREFVQMNKGKMQIISGEGFYQYDGHQEDFKMFVGQFPGTIVNLQFKTDDANNYLLNSEIDIDDIF